MNGRLVGRLTRLASGALRFAYHPEWLASAIATPISLSLPLTTQPYAGGVVASFFDNLLPDNDDMRRRMQASLGTESARPFDLLAAAGADCVGALQLFEGDVVPDVRRIEASRISDGHIARILRDRGRPLGMTPAEDDFRVSIAGAQEKTAFLWHRGRWHRPRAATPTSHVFKLPIGAVAGGVDLSDSVENEWLSLRLVEAFDLPVAQAELRRFEDQRVLVVERFDRRWADDRSWLIRLPQEDMCQALGVPPARKYQADGGPGVAAIMELLLQANDPAGDRARFVKTLVVFWLLAAIDGHAKSFSVFLYPGGRVALTPGYDVMSAYPLMARRQLAPQKVKLAMALHGKSAHYRWREIKRHHWLATAKRCGFSDKATQAILDACVANIDRAVQRAAGALPDGFPTAVSGPIFAGLRALQRAL
jgi:serine/threonine-protein kinase HipA